MCQFGVIWCQYGDDVVLMEIVLYFGDVDWQQVFVFGMQFGDCVGIDMYGVVYLQVIDYLLFVCGQFGCGCMQGCVDGFVICQVQQYIRFLVLGDDGVCVVVGGVFGSEDFGDYVVVFDV